MIKRTKHVIRRAKPTIKRAKPAIKVITIASAMTLLACLGYNFITWLIP